MAQQKVFVVGVGMTKFVKPGSRDDFDYPVMVKESVSKCLEDAKIPYDKVQQAFVGYVYGESTCGQRCLYDFGFTGIPIFNVNNNCATGSSALFLAFNKIKYGEADCVLAVGFEKMEAGALTSKYDDRENPLERHLNVLQETRGIDAAPFLPQMFGSAAREHMEKYGSTPDHFAKIALKNHAHSVHNPYSQMQTKYSLDDIKNSKSVFHPLTKLQCCPTSDGSAAVVVASEKFVKQNKLEDQAVEILGMEMTTDTKGAFADNSCIKMVGFDMTRMAAQSLFAKTGKKIQDVDVIELHDCFSSNELLTYEALGLCPIGQGSKLVDGGDNTYGGKYVINPSGGLISKGHPLGATGLAQCTELCWQLRGLAAKRQVTNCKLALQHNIGLGGAAVVALYAKFKPSYSKSSSNEAKISRKSTDENEGKGFKVQPIFRIIKNQLAEEGAKYVQKMKGIFAFQVTNGPNGQTAVWLVDAKNNNGSVKFADGPSDVRIIMNDSDLFDLMVGKLNPQKAFMSKKLKIKGKLPLAMKLRQFKPADLKAKL